MKIAGRKNDGAWYRTNKAINDLTISEKESLKAKLLEALNNKGEAWIADMNSLADECGVAHAQNFENWDTYTNTLVSNGIPRQLWNGRLSFTTYGLIDGTGVNGVPAKYFANYQSNVHYLAKDLRRFFKYWLMGLREIKDLSNVLSADLGNPGGIADADDGIA